MSNTVPKQSIFFSTAHPDLGRIGRPRLGFLRPILAFSALAIAALSASGQNITSTVNTNHEAVAIDVISSQNTIYVATGDNTLTAINGANNAVTVFNDPAAANTSGASAMVTYFNNVLVLNKNSNNITSYFAFLSGTSNQEQVQQIFSEPNTNQPVAIVLDPVNFGRIFVANAGSNSVSIFDNVNGNGWQLTASLTNIPDPQAMVINVNTHQVFVIGGNTNTVTVIDGTSNTVRGTVQVGNSPKSLAFNTATNQVYVADANAQSIVDIDANTLSTTTISIPNSIPTAIAVNPVTNQIFEVSETGLVTIIDGVTNTVTRTVTVAANDNPSGQAAIAVDPTTNLAYVEITGAQLYIIDGATGSVSSVSSGTGGNAVLALNPVTHKVYIDNGASGITVVDGATNVAGNIQPGQTQPYAVVVNPATNKIYVANFGSNTVSVVDGATNTVTAEVGTDSNPNAIAVDPARNLIFATNFNSSSATIIDGSNNSATSQSISNANPDSITVNPVIGRVYGASSTQNVIFGFLSDANGGNLNFYPSFKTGPIAVAFNAATGVNFELDSGGALEADDGAFPARGITFVCPGSTPTAMDVNPVTNKVYVACTDGEIDAVFNAGGFSNGSNAGFQDPAAVKPAAVAVNSATNQIFIANAGDGTGNGSLTILDGASGNITNVPLSGTPVALAVNVATNKIYVQSQVDASTSSIIIVDGASQVVISTIGGFTAGPLTQQIAVNPAAGEVFAVNRTAGNNAGTLTTVTENTAQPDGIATTITPFPGNTTASVTPTFNFTVHNTLDGASAYVVYYQIDSQPRDWNFGSNTSAQNFSGSLTTPLTPGYHTVYAYAVTGDETSGNSSNNGVGFQNNPIVGSIASYGFMVAPPIAGGTILPIDFGAEPSGSQTVAHQAILTSVGAGPISFTYTITGVNAADFKEVPYTGTDTLCNTLGGALPSSNYCDVNIAFQPSTTGPETATLTFATNSMGIAGSTQTVLLTGLGTAATQEPLTVTFTGSGKVTDNLSLLNCTASPCTQNYTPNQVVILTATPNSGYTFTGWSGACSGLGTCTVTMNGNQSVNATFAPTGSTFSIALNTIGTGNGTVTDNVGQINCTTAAGVQSGTCSGTYPGGSIVPLSATPGGTSTFAGFSGACSGASPCSVDVAGPETVTASFAPQPQLITLAFPAGSTVSEMATFDCPSNANPSPGNPCLDPNAHSLALSVPTVLTPFTVTVQATEVPPSVADGICPNGATPTTDFDCRFVSFFTYQTNTNGDKVVPLCYPYANGNCVHYLVFSGQPGTEPPPADYVGPIDWTISWNNDHFIPPAPYLGSTPRVYDDPDYAVSPTSPFGTNCSTPMLVGNPPVATNPPIFCQFEFDITTFFNPTKPVDATIGARTKQFNDVVVAFPPANAGLVTVTNTPDSATVVAGNPIGFTLAIANNSAGAATSATLKDPLPAGSGVNWSISPAYTGPGTCAINGAVGAQELDCTFGNIPVNTSFSLHLASPTTAAGTFTNAATVSVTNQQVLSIGTITVTAPTVVTAVFTGLTPSQSITAGTASITLSGSVVGGNLFAPAGETVSITINGATQPVTIGANGTFSKVFPTANIPASATPYAIAYSYPGDVNLSPASDSSTTLTVTPLVQLNFTLSVTEIGTGNGTLKDGQGLINCTTTAGTSSGTCSATYPNGTQVALTATPVAPSTFAGYSGACTGTGACSITMTANQSVTASFAPAPQSITLSYAPGTTVQQMATYDCPSNPNPSPTNPCLDPNAHSLALSVPTVLTPFTVTVQATEVPPSVADGICPNGAAPNTDFDCRFVSFFTYQTNANGDKVVPLCYPYANGNCVHYLVFSGQPGTEPPTADYVGPIDWTISWNNDHFIPPAPYLGSTPRVYDDPDYAVSPTSPFGTNCSTPMLVGNPPVATNPPIFCQFEFDITTFFNPTKPVDATIGARTKQFNDVVVAFPPANAGLVTVTNTPDAATVVAGSPIGFTVSIANNSAGAATSATLKDPLPAGSGVNWSISPAYTGPGTCAINGAVGAQELDCTFGTIAVNASFTIHLVSASSSIGNFTNAAAVTVFNQQVLSIGTITVTGVTQTITFAASPISAAYGTTFNASATASSGLPVTIVASGSCSVVGATVTITSGTGTCTLAASQAGNTHYGPAMNVVHNVTAQKAVSTAAITATAPNPSVVAQAVTVSFKVTGTGTPTGSVSVKASTGETCTGTLSSGAGSCSITFATTGTRTLTAAYSGDGNFNSTVSAGFSQMVNPAATSQLSISPTNINFGQVLLGFLGVKFVTLTNKGTTPIAISKIAPSHVGTGDFADFDILSLCPKSLGAGKSCAVVVSFIPLHDNPTGVVSTSSILITDNAAGSPQAITVSAQTINPVAKLSATSLSFATPQKVGTTSPSQIITLTNVGSSPLVLGKITSTGADFTLPAAGTTCAAGATLAPTKSCTIAVAFAPKTKGLRIGTVQINDNALITPLLLRLIGQAN